MWNEPRSKSPSIELNINTGDKCTVSIKSLTVKRKATNTKRHEFYHLPILRTCCDVSQNSAMKYSSENNSPFLFAMVLPPESNLTLISVFLPSVIHVDNLPVLISVTKINWHLTHIHSSHVVVREKKQQQKAHTPPAVVTLSKELQFSHFKILYGSVRFYYPYSVSRHSSYHVFSRCTLE